MTEKNVKMSEKQSKMEFSMFDVLKFSNPIMSYTRCGNSARSAGIVDDQIASNNAPQNNQDGDAVGNQYNIPPDVPASDSFESADSARDEPAPPDNSDYLETVDPHDHSDDGEYAIYGANKEYLAAEVKKLREEMERLAERPIYSVLKEKITHSVIFM